MSRKLFFLLGLVGILSATPFSGNAQVKVEGMCPVMPGKKVSERFYVDYEGKRIYLCCAPCIRAFKKNPGKYLRNLSEKL